MTNRPAVPVGAFQVRPGVAVGDSVAIDAGRHQAGTNGFDLPVGRSSLTEAVRRRAWALSALPLLAVTGRGGPSKGRPKGVIQWGRCDGRSIYKGSGVPLFRSIMRPRSGSRSRH